MGRRKKESKSAHRKNISSAASELFMKKGIYATSMDDIAKASGYSKATLYVYFKNKDEIIDILALESMQKLYDYISYALEHYESATERYISICQGLVQYQEEFPYYFKTVLEKINIDYEDQNDLSVEKETYLAGEKINEKLKDFIISGIENGELRKDIKILPEIFNFWGMLSGIIQLATNKEEYIKVSMGMTKNQFLDYGFQTLYRSIRNTEE